LEAASLRAKSNPRALTEVEGGVEEEEEEEEVEEDAAAPAA
jgi:hypothetical protein